jgi:DNA-binding CsgD family transcriptional regulator
MRIYRTCETHLISAHIATASSTYPAGLSARELEELRLVAQGLSDAQVFDQLVISQCTVIRNRKYTLLSLITKTIFVPARRIFS